MSDKTDFHNTDGNYLQNISDFILQSADEISKTANNEKFMTLSTCTVAKFEKALSRFLYDSQNWKNTTNILLHASLLEKLLKILFSNHVISELSLSAYGNVILCNDVIEGFYHLSISNEKIVRFTAKDILSTAVVQLYDQEGASQFERVVTLLFSLILGCDSQSESWCWNVEMVTSLLEQFQKTDNDTPQLLLNYLMSFINKFSSILFKGKQRETFVSCLFLLHQILHLKLKCLPLLNIVYQKACFVFENFHLMIMHSSHRQLYFEVLKTFLKYPPLPELFLLSTNSSKLYCDIFSSFHIELKQCFENLPNFVGFGGYKLQETDYSRNDPAFTKCERMLVLNGFLHALCNLTNVERYVDVSAYENLAKSLVICTDFENVGFAKKIIQMYIEQDDFLIEMLLLHLTMCSSAKLAITVFCASPHALFVTLLQHISFDHSVLLDWLTSNETQFLLYFLKYLKYLVSTYAGFYVYCNSLGGLDDATSLVISTLQRLRSSIERLCSKNLFPYPVKPLLKVLVSVKKVSESSYRT